MLRSEYIRLYQSIEETFRERLVGESSRINLTLSNRIKHHIQTKELAFEALRVIWAATSDFKVPTDEEVQAAVSKNQTKILKVG